MQKVVKVIIAYMLITGTVVAQERLELAARFKQFVAVDTAVVVLQGANVIDGTGGPVLKNQSIVMEGSKIKAVGPASEVKIPTGAQVLDLANHTVIPGFVGMHNHTYYTTSKRSIQLNYSAPRLYLASGLTTIRTTGSRDAYSELNLKKAIESGQAIGPRIFVTGPYITGGTGFTTMTRVNSPEAARRVVAYWAEEGVSWFKAYTQISRAELGAAIDEAHKRGIKVTGHLCSVSYREAVELGIDNLEHGLFANTDYDPEKEPDACPPGAIARLIDVDVNSAEVKATFKDMIDNNVAMTSTLAVYEMYVPGRPPIEQRVLDAMSPEVRDEFLTTRKQIADAAKNNRGFVLSEKLFKIAQAYELAFVRAGGLLAAGVDPTGYGGALPGYGDQRNYELLLEAGFSPVEVIQIMTANGAKVLGIFDEIGTVTPGKNAELVVINGDPVAKPEEIRNVKYVFKDGFGFDSEKIIESVSGEVGVR